MSVYEILETLAANSSRNFKIDFLKQNRENETLKRVCFLALNPAINFYIKKIPAEHRISGFMALDTALDVLQQRIAERVVTGDAAKLEVSRVLGMLDDYDADVIKRVISRDLRCGVSDSTVNAVWKGLIPEYPYMRCCLPKQTKLDKFNWKRGVYSQLKADGMFGNINVLPDSTIEITSRNGSIFPMEKFADLASEISAKFKADTQTHGEVLVRRSGQILSREIGNGILNSVLKGGDFGPNEVPIVLVWDQIPLAEVKPGNKYKVEYETRFNVLAEQVSQCNELVGLIETKIVNSYDEAYEHYIEMLDKGFEGTIIKDPSAIWEDTTSKLQVKFKLEVDVDLMIVDFTPGKGKNESTFGSITCQSSDGELIVNVSGFKDKPQKGILTRQQIFDIKDELINTVMCVRSNGVMKPTKSNPKYSLFLPRYVEFRLDKKSADSLVQIIEQFENAIRRK